MYVVYVFMHIYWHFYQTARILKAIVKLHKCQKAFVREHVSCGNQMKQLWDMNKTTKFI